MLSADYWIEHTKRARQTILTLEDTAALSRKIKDTPGTHCTDILAYPAMLPRGLILQKMKTSPHGPRAGGI